MDFKLGDIVSIKEGVLGHISSKGVITQKYLGGHRIYWLVQLKGSPSRIWFTEDELALETKTTIDFIWEE